MGLYEDLGVAPDATPEEVKRAYRKRAQQSHPDKPGGDADVFHQVTVAYQVLSDPGRRAQYDATGTVDDGPEQLAERMVAEVLDRFISNEELEGDIIERCRQHFRGQIAGQEREKTSARKTLAKLNRMSGRVKAKRTNLFQKILDSKVKKIEDWLVQADRNLELFAMAVEVLEDYEDTRPEAAEYVTPPWPRGMPVWPPST